VLAEGQDETKKEEVKCVENHVKYKARAAKRAGDRAAVQKGGAEGAFEPEQNCSIFKLCRPRRFFENHENHEDRFVSHCVRLTPGIICSLIETRMRCHAA
jgi:hypothetical protein